MSKRGQAEHVCGRKRVMCADRTVSITCVCYVQVCVCAWGCVRVEVLRGGGNCRWVACQTTLSALACNCGGPFSQSSWKRCRLIFFFLRGEGGMGGGEQPQKHRRKRNQDACLAQETASSEIIIGQDGKKDHHAVYKTTPNPPTAATQRISARVMASCTHPILHSTRMETEKKLWLGVVHSGSTSILDRDRSIKNWRVHCGITISPRFARRLIQEGKRSSGFSAFKSACAKWLQLQVNGSYLSIRHSTESCRRSNTMSISVLESDGGEAFICFDRAGQRDIKGEAELERGSFTGGGGGGGGLFHGGWLPCQHPVSSALPLCPHWTLGQICLADLQ